MVFSTTKYLDFRRGRMIGYLLQHILKKITKGKIEGSRGKATAKVFRPSKSECHVVPGQSKGS